MGYRAIVIGASAGGIEAVTEILASLPARFTLPLVIVQHLHKEQDDYLIQFYNSRTQLEVEEAKEKEKIVPGRVYIAPPDYHLLIEQDETFSLSMDEKVNYSRPSIDVLFESAADVYSGELTGVLLTGANNDGAQGLRRIKKNGGLTLVQDPETAKFPEMPRSAMACTEIDHILTIHELGIFLTALQTDLPG
ncbi:MAG: chemotaxis protein CheB [Candidatus Electrothrix sp. AR4]|nr:chemotaxis protein CheB [Candidatus Electrothrix sp. AR4]